VTISIDLTVDGTKVAEITTGEVHFAGTLTEVGITTTTVLTTGITVT